MVSPVAKEASFDMKCNYKSYRSLAIGLCGLIVLLGSVTAIVAKTIEGVEFPPAIDVSGAKLSLNGTAMREKFFFDIYIAALYLEHPSTDATSILQDPGAKRMRFHFLYRELEREKLVTAWREAFAKNLSADEQKSAESGLLQLAPMLDDEYHAGDELILDVLPSGAGLAVSSKGVAKGLVTVPVFPRAVLEAWIGSNPPSAKFKHGLLGGSK